MECNGDYLPYCESEIRHLSAQPEAKKTEEQHQKEVPQAHVQFVLLELLWLFFDLCG